MGRPIERFAFPDGKRGVNENTMSVRGDHVWLGGAGGVQLFTQGRVLPDAMEGSGFAGQSVWHCGNSNRRSLGQRIFGDHARSRV